MIKRLRLWLRWQIARLANRIEDTCWCDLVLWAISPDRNFSEIFDLRHTAGGCKRMGCVPYCGKCIDENAGDPAPSCREMCNRWAREIVRLARLALWVAVGLALAAVGVAVIVTNSVTK